MNSYMVHTTISRLKIKSKPIVAKNEGQYYKQPWLVIFIFTNY